MHSDSHTYAHSRKALVLAFEAKAKARPKAKAKSRPKAKTKSRPTSETRPKAKQRARMTPPSPHIK
eukprot:618338-Amorphochlora_amoeboformis.AAC.1